MRLVGREPGRVQTCAAQKLSIRRRRRSSTSFVSLALLAVVLAPRGAYALPACPASISSCCSIVSPGTYNIPNNFAASIGSGPCIDITVPDVTLNNANGNVTGPGSSTATTGVIVEATAPRATLNGCFIFCSGGAYSGFGTGLLVNGNAARVNFVSANNNGRGIVLDGTGPALFLSAGSNNVGNGVVVNSTAIAPLLNTVSANQNGKTGIKLNQVSGGLIENPTSSNNGQYGVWLNGTTGTSVTDPVANSNTIAGIFLGCSGTGPSTAVCAVPTKGNVVMKVLSSSSTVTVNGPSQKYGVVVDTGSRLNRVELITANSNTTDDMFDGNLNCDNNFWFLDTFTNKNQSCIQ